MAHTVAELGFSYFCCRRPGHRERFCRARFPVARSRSPDSCGRSPDDHAPCQRSRSPSPQPSRPPLSRSWAEVVCQSPLRATVPPRPSSRCGEEFSGNSSLDSLLQSQVALMRMELLQPLAEPTPGRAWSADPAHSFGKKNDVPIHVSLPPQSRTNCSRTT
jgi:hypothetical protein